MKRIIGLIAILIMGIYFTIWFIYLGLPVSEVSNEVLPAKPPGIFNNDEKRLFDFINKYLLMEDGSIYTNIKSYVGSKDTLSESVGLVMNYCVLKGNQKLFDREVMFVKNTMLSEKGMIKWRTGSSSSYCNAVIDDFRIIHALLDASDKWGNKSYFNLAGDLQAEIYNKQVNGYELFELYDWKDSRSKHSIPLCYLDMYTIHRLGDFNSGWLRINDAALTLVNNGRISETSPFFYKSYDYKLCRYLLDEEYKYNKGICLTYSLYTGIHLAQMNENTEYLTKWLEKEISKGLLYAWYNPYTLKPVNKMESTAVYALAVIYADKVGEKALCRQLLNKMFKFRVTNKNSLYYGGFGDIATDCFYSFDNLTALWALAAADR